MAKRKAKKTCRKETAKLFKGFTIKKKKKQMFGIKTRKFDGKRLSVRGTHHLKRKAKKEASRRREHGKKARVVRTAKGWAVYS